MIFAYPVITFATGVGIARGNIKRYRNLGRIAISNFFTLAAQSASLLRGEMVLIGDERVEIFMLIHLYKGK
jgi:hypothetical protein